LGQSADSLPLFKQLGNLSLKNLSSFKCDTIHVYLNLNIFDGMMLKVPPPPIFRVD
jgi:hypothetical protein